PLRMSDCRSQISNCTLNYHLKFEICYLPSRSASRIDDSPDTRSTICSRLRRWYEWCSIEDLNRREAQPVQRLANRRRADADQHKNCHESLPRHPLPVAEAPRQLQLVRCAHDLTQHKLRLQTAPFDCGCAAIL